MTASPTIPGVGGISDFDLPMVTATVRFRIAWLKALKAQALTRTNNGDPCDVSQIVREAVALWADEHGINLNSGII